MQSTIVPTIHLGEHSGISFDHLDATAQAEVQLMFMARENLQLFETLYEAYSEPIFRYCLRHTNDVQEAEDIRSQVFVRALKGIHTFRGGLVPAWLFSITRNELATYYRKNRRPMISLDDLDLPDSNEEDWEGIEETYDRHALATMLTDLPLEHRNLLMLSFYQGLTSPEIGEILSKNPITVRTGLRRIILGLRQQFMTITPERSLSFSN